MPPVPDKARTGRFFGRRVMEFQNWTLASNVRWQLTDEQLAVLWQAEFPNSRTRYTMKDVRTVRNLFNRAGARTTGPGPSGLSLRWPPGTTVRPSSDPVRRRPRRPAGRDVSTSPQSMCTAKKAARGRSH